LLGKDFLVLGRRRYFEKEGMGGRLVGVGKKKDGVCEGEQRPLALSTKDILLEGLTLGGTKKIKRKGHLSSRKSQHRLGGTRAQVNKDITFGVKEIERCGSRGLCVRKGID